MRSPLRTPPERIPAGVVLVNLISIAACAVAWALFGGANPGLAVGIAPAVVSLAMALARPHIHRAGKKGRGR